MALESSFAFFLLSVIAVCTVVMTVTVVMTAREARRTFHRINILLPSCRQTLRQARKFLASVNYTASQVDLMVSAVSAAAAHAVHQFVEVKHRLERWLHHTPNGNGTGAGSGARPFRHRTRG